MSNTHHSHPTAPHAIETDMQDLALSAARAALGSDSHLDRPTVSVHLPVPLADALLEARGWRIERYAVDDQRHGIRAGAARAVHAPDGERYWERDEALTVALTAEAFDMDPELTDAM